MAPASLVQCCICLEDFPSCNLRHCGRADCGKSAYCLDCLRQHAETVVHGGLYAAPSVRCPSCNRRLGTESWASTVGEQTLLKYYQNARALLTYRCAACDETGSYFTESSSSRDPFATLDLEVCERLGGAWHRFFLAHDSAEDFLQAILDEHGCSHRSGGSPPAKLSKVFGPSGSAPWISDLERRLALQLAWMHRFPKQRTPCCGERFCFRCKVSSWHRGISCQERLQTEKARQAQACPGCGVPTIRSEGCRKITCVCSRVWEWEGDDSSEEGTFSDDGSDEDVSEAQTMMNLVAMNSRAAEESVTTVVQALVNARADVNQSGVEAPVPLLLAVQCRHAAAVAALCEHGARVTPEILEEVKTISHEASRHRIEELLRPQVQGDPNMKLPLWVWVQAGSAPAVEALLRNAAHEEVVGEDVLIALHRTHADEENRRKMVGLVRERVGETRFQELESSAATRRLLLELRQAHDEERDADLGLVREALRLGADADAREEGDEDEVGMASGYGLPGLNLVAMNTHAGAASVVGAIEALLEARADVNAETDQASTPLLAALRHRNMPAVEALCKGPVKFMPDILDEVRSLSEPSRRHRVEELLRPVVRGNGSRRLPLWVWVQDGSPQAVEALLRTSQPRDEQVNVDALVALQRCRGSEENRQRIEETLRQHVGPEEFARLQAAAATQRLLQELREAYDDRRDASMDLIHQALSQGADASAQEEDPNDFEDDVRAYSFTALQLASTNTYASPESVHQAVDALVEAKADVNVDVSDCPLLTAVQQRCIPGIEVLTKHGAKVTPDVLEELKNISATKTRTRVEDILQPLIDRDKSLRCPLWIWVQFGGVTAVEALLRNAAHEEEVDADVLMALQRCRGGAQAHQQLAEHLRKHVGEEEFRRLEQAAATRRLLQELREAHTEERDLDLGVVCESLAQGANPNAREEEVMDDAEEMEEEDGDEDDEEEDEEDAEGAEDEDDDTEEAAAEGEDEQQDEYVEAEVEEKLAGEEEEEPEGEEGEPEEELDDEDLP